jgi:hypothetical protein
MHTANVFQTYYGTKDLIECKLSRCVGSRLTHLGLAYIDELESALKYIRDTPLLSHEEKRRFFKNSNTNLGLSALCLSGGATFAYCKI